MKSVSLGALLLTLFATGCLDLRVEVPVSEFVYTQSDAEAQIRKSLKDYLPTIASSTCEKKAVAFLLQTTVPMDPNVAFPSKIRSDTIKAQEYAPGQKTCVDIDATSYINDNLQMRPRITRHLKLRAENVAFNDCQEKLADPEKTQVDTLWLSITQNSLNVDISAGRVYYATREIQGDELTGSGIAELIGDGTLIQFAFFDSLAKGTDKELEIPIDEVQKVELTKRLLSKNIDIVIDTDQLEFNQVIDRGHGYLELVSGQVSIDVSAIVVTNVGFFDLACLNELPKTSSKYL